MSSHQRVQSFERSDERSSELRQVVERRLEHLSEGARHCSAQFLDEVGCENELIPFGGGEAGSPPPHRILAAVVAEESRLGIQEITRA